MTFKDKVIEALCADRDFWFNEFDDVCENYGIDVSDFYDENGNMLDRRQVAEYLLDNIDFLYDLADKYGIIDDEFYGDVMERVVRRILKEDIDINPENKGKFTATQKRTGKSTEELCHSKNKKTKQRANFARMAKRHWKPLKENEEYDDDLSPFEEYEQGYPNEDFDVSDMTPEKLAKWCRSVGDFLYVFEGLRGMSIMCANVDSIVYDIVKDLYDCQRIEPTHEVDYLFRSREREFINDYVCIFKVIGTKDGDYYVVYQEDKYGRGNIDLDESKTYITEAFKSNELRQWFKLHGGVKRLYTEPEYSNLKDKRVFQDGLGDITDDDIVYLEEFNDFNEAMKKRYELIASNPYTRQRSDWDMKAHFTIYKANDGTCLLVGIDRQKVEIGTTWGGEKTKKTADRMMRNGWNMKTRSNRYVDDSDTYYYSDKGNYFGLKTNRNYKGLQSDNERRKEHMSDEEWKEYQKERVKDIRDYSKKHRF